MRTQSLSSLTTSGLLWTAEGDNTQQVHERLLSIPFGIKEIDELLPQRGLPLGTIHEWRCAENFIPCAFFSLLASAQIKHFNKKVVWIEERVWPLPHSLFEYSKALVDKSYFIKVASKARKLWVLDQAVRTKGIGVIIAQVEALPLSTMRRLSLAAKESGVVVLLFKRQELPAYGSTALTRWEVSFGKGSSAYPIYTLKLCYYKGLGINGASWNVDFNSNKPFVTTDTSVEDRSTITPSSELQRICL